MHIFKGESFAEVYQCSLTELLYNPEYEVSPRGMAIKEFTNAALVIDNPKLCLYGNARRSSQFKYISAELLWYFMGHNDLKFIQQYAKFWQQIANSDGTVNSAYGNLLFKEVNQHGLNQWQWAYQSLVNDKDTRQAIMMFNKPSYQYRGNKDFICTLNGAFNIRDNKLNFTVQMRSNDAILGTPTDIPFFCLLQQQMWKLLKENKYSNLKLGSFTLLDNSYHIYERHFDLVNQMLQSDFKALEIPDIGLNLIDKDGNATKYLKSLFDYIVANKSKYYTSDELINWIDKNLVHYTQDQ